MFGLSVLNAPSFQQEQMVTLAVLNAACGSIARQWVFELVCSTWLFFIVQQIVAVLHVASYREFLVPSLPVPFFL